MQEHVSGYVFLKEKWSNFFFRSYVLLIAIISVKDASTNKKLTLYFQRSKPLSPRMNSSTVLNSGKLQDG